MNTIFGTLIVVALIGVVYFMYLNQNSDSESMITPASIIDEQLSEIRDTRQENIDRALRGEI